jgi:phosphomannomutase
MKAFKAYDIRGVYGRDFTASDVEKIGYFLPKLLKADTVLVGRDARVSSPEIFEALCRGITSGGADVVSIGLSTTPTIYFTVATKGFDASVQITASHNPPEYNGLKVCRTGAIPVDYSTGLADLQKMCETEEIIPLPARGIVHEIDVRGDYLDFLRHWLPDLSGLRIGIDCSNGMAALLIKELLGPDPIYIHSEIDGTFPNHQPNPLEEENCADIKKLVIDNQLDIGLIFDGDADRLMFIDERGRCVQPDLITAVLAEYYLAKEKGRVLHDIRTSKAVAERIIELGGEPHMWKVGHSFAKVKMRELGCIVGGELAGHYYFRDFFNCDSGILAGLIVLSVAARLKAEGKPFSNCIDGLMRYANSGEINFRVKAKDEAITAVVKKLITEKTPQAIYDFDGVRLEFDDWWVSVRSSNTEPWLRVVIEADNETLLAEKRAAIEKVLAEFVQ